MSVTRTNLFLDSLSTELRSELLAGAKEIPLPVRTSLQRQEEFPKYAYFLTSGIASYVIALAEGGTAEVALAGREAVIDAFSLLGPSPSPTDCFMQIAGAGYRVLSKDLRKLFDGSAEIRARVLAYVQAQSMTTAQIAACNKLHDAESRLARWLLMVQDRVQADSFTLTQEFMAQMLGTRRSTVALATNSLQRGGLLENHRGTVKILSREALRDCACDCYPVAERLFSNLYR